MPAARKDIDRDAVATSIALHGYRETARRTGIPLGTVQRIGALAGVKAPNHLHRHVPITAVRRIDTPPTQQSAFVHVGTPSHAIASDALAEKGARSRFAAAEMGAVAFEALASMPVAEMLQRTQEAANLATVQVRANVPGWERREQVTNTQGDAISEADLERLLSAALAKLPELEAEVRRLDA